MKFEQFNLTNQNKGKFFTAEFERRVYPMHLRGILKAINDGKMFDNIISVIPDGNRFKIIDGQHRFYAFLEILTDEKRKSIPILLRIFDEKEMLRNGRETYLALDSAKALTIRDILKAYDDGKTPFFTILKQWCSNYGGSKTLPYALVLSGIKYTNTNIPDIRRREVNLKLFDILNEDLRKMGYILSNLFMATNKNLNSVLFRVLIFRNIVKFTFDNQECVLKQAKYQNFLQELLKDKFINSIVSSKTIEAYAQVYDYLKRKWLKV